MRGPSLQKTALLSFVLHLTAFLITVLILKQSNHMITPSPYTVNLVNTDIARGTERSSNGDVVKEVQESSAPAAVPREGRKESVKDRKLIEEKLSALAAKKKKLDTLSRLREISIKAGSGKRTPGAKAEASTPGKSSTPDDYSSRITEGIHQYWSIPPGVEKKGLETVVSIRILKDGTVIVQNVEKKSGSSLFDRSALQALAKSSPLPRPPYEMEIGIRFHP